MKKIEEKIKDTVKDFEYIYPHVLRHTFAARGLENGIQPEVMQELLGHTSITMTMDIYSVSKYESRRDKENGKLIWIILWEVVHKV